MAYVRTITTTSAHPAVSIDGAGAAHRHIKTMRLAPALGPHTASRRSDARFHESTAAGDAAVQSASVWVLLGSRALRCQHSESDCSYASDSVEHLFARASLHQAHRQLHDATLNTSSLSPRALSPAMTGLTNNRTRRRCCRPCHPRGTDPKREGALQPHLIQLSHTGFTAHSPDSSWPSVRQRWADQPLSRRS